MRVADLAVTAGAVAPTRCDDNMITLLQPRRLGHEPAQLMHQASYFVTRNDRRWNVVVLSEIPVNELDVGATHSTGLNPDEHLIWRNVRNRHVLENKAFVVLPDASRLHGYLLQRVWMRCSNA
jgi:hypothetical protein